MQHSRFYSSWGIFRRLSIRNFIPETWGFPPTHKISLPISMQNSMKKGHFWKSPHENMHGTKQCSNNLRSLSQVLMWLTNHHILNQAGSWETRRDPHYVMTDSGEALKVLLSTASAARWELLGANADFITKTTFLGLKDRRAAVWSIAQWLIAPPQVHASDRTKKFCLF